MIRIIGTARNAGDLWVLIGRARNRTCGTAPRVGMRESQMTNRYAQFEEIYNELNNLRSCIKDLTQVTTNLLDRLERLEEAAAIRSTPID